MIAPSGSIFAFTLTLLAAAGCAKQTSVRLADAPIAVTQTTGARPRAAFTGPALSVSQDIMTACNISLDNVDRAPKFDFDNSTLLPQDRDVLRQVAACVTTGPLRGRALTLVGRADPRGEAEYNFALGEHRDRDVARQARCGRDGRGRVVQGPPCGLGAAVIGACSRARGDTAPADRGTP